jgi:hypothetical protein
MSKDALRWAAVCVPALVCLLTAAPRSGAG